MLFVSCDYVGKFGRASFLAYNFLSSYLMLLCLYLSYIITSPILAVDSVDSVCFSIWEGVPSKFMTLNTFRLFKLCLFNNFVLNFYKHLC